MVLNYVCPIKSWLCPIYVLSSIVEFSVQYSVVFFCPLSPRQHLFWPLEASVCMYGRRSAALARLNLLDQRQVRLFDCSPASCHFKLFMLMLILTGIEYSETVILLMYGSTNLEKREEKKKLTRARVVSTAVMRYISRRSAAFKNQLDAW